MMRKILKEQAWKAHTPGPKDSNYRDFSAGFDAASGAIIDRLRSDLRRARNALALARQNAEDLTNPIDALVEMRRACEAQSRIDYLENMLFELTGGE